ncbi:MAG: cation diffusion facilitator family transporter [Lapillicoccus sp.]
MGSSERGHAHSTAPSDHRGRLAVVLCITSVVLLAEVVGALLSGSLALVADAGHMLSDVAGLSLAWFAATLSRRPPNDQRTWGYRRAEVLAAAGQAAVLLAVGGFVLVEGVRRLFEPPEVMSGLMVVFGMIGLVGNAASMAVLASARDSNLNLRAAFLEVVNDAIGSVAVIVAAVLIALTGWLRADALASILIGLLIVPRTIKLLRESIDVLMETTPKHIDLAAVRARLLATPHVHDVHELHVSQVATGLPVLTAHVVVDESCFNDGDLPRMLDQIQGRLARDFSLQHSTIQFEASAHAAHERPEHD